jgi:hypothetical protein
VCTVLRKSLQALQHVGGAYSLASASKEHDARASLRGFQEGDNLRVLRPKDEIEVGSIDTDATSAVSDKLVTRYPGYAVKLTWEVPVHKTHGILKVNACWHEIVFRNECGFAESNFLF